MDLPEALLGESINSRLREIFFPRASEQRRNMLRSKCRLAHYTSATVAASIIRNSELWMRKTTTMDDFGEVAHGWACLKGSYSASEGQRLKAAIEAVSPGLCEEVESLFDDWMPSFAENTYVACFSEHADSEDSLGRLSMWRAYGGDAGVALVLNSAPIHSESDAFKVYSAPAAYLHANGLAAEMAKVAGAIENDREFLSGVGRDLLVGHFFTLFRYAVLCTKHPGFHEEREWRAIYNPSLESSDRVKTEVEVVKGVPQLVTKVPLRSFPEEGLNGLDLPDLLDRVIIGPTQYSKAMREAFVSLLRDANVVDPESKVIVSNIPLRR